MRSKLADSALFNALLKVDFHVRVTPDGGLILMRKLIGKAEALDFPRRVVPDMDSTEIPAYGE